MRIYYSPLKTAETVTTVEVVGLDTPVNGANPDFDLIPAEDSFYINGVYWTDVTDSKNHISMKENHTFVSGHTYELEVWIRANDEYRFRTDSDDCLDISSLVGGKEAEVVLPGSVMSAELRVTFTVGGGTDTPTDPTDNTTKPADPEIVGILGDANVDSDVNIKDATAIQKHIAKLESLTDTGFILADVDASSDVNIKDATAIQKFIAGIDTGFSIGEAVYK